MSSKALTGVRVFRNGKEIDVTRLSAETDAADRIIEAERVQFWRDREGLRAKVLRKLWSMNNRERENAKKREWYRKNRESVLAKNAAYRDRFKKRRRKSRARVEEQ